MIRRAAPQKVSYNSNNQRRTRTPILCIRNSNNQTKQFVEQDLYRDAKDFIARNDKCPSYFEAKTFLNDTINKKVTSMDTHKNSILQSTAPSVTGMMNSTGYNLHE